MNGQVDLTQFAEETIRRRSARPTQGGPGPAARRRPLLRRPQPARPGPRRHGPLQRRARHHPRRSTPRTREDDAGRAGDPDRAGPDRRRPRQHARPACPSRCATARDMPKPTQPILTTDKVRFVGDPVAVVVAETAKQAKDAAEAVFVDIDTAAGGHRSRRRRRARRAAGARRDAGQRHPRLPPRRHRRPSPPPSPRPPTSPG